MLQIKNLNIVHKKDLHTILTDFHFVLNPGDKAVIIGEEGNGKSTLLKWIFDPALAETYVEASGERICVGERIGYLPQELPPEACLKSLYEFFCEEEAFLEQTPKELGILAANLHLPMDFFYGEQRMGTLSGGEKVKAQMARILMAEPTVLLLDEPSNDIDIETLEWLEELIGNTKQAVLYISHDETLIERTANVVLHMEQLRRKTVSRYTVARMPYRQYMEQRDAGLQKQEQEALNEKRQERIRQEKFRRIQQKVEHEQNAVSRQDPHSGYLLKKKMKAVTSMGKRFAREAQNMTRMPETEEAIFLKFGEDIHIPAGKTVLDFRIEQLWTQGNRTQENRTQENRMQENQTQGNRAQENRTRENEMEEKESEPRLLSQKLCLRVWGSEKVCIIGRNGAGKTTLLRQIAAQLLERKDLRAAYMPQNYEDLLEMEQTPVEYLAEAGDKEEVTRIRTYLGSMKYTAEEMSHPIRELSGGQKAKVLLLKMSLSGAEVLILDEPTRNFSPLSNPIIREVLSAFGGAIISISHDRKYIRQVCDTVYRLTPQGLIPVDIAEFVKENETILANI